MAEMAEKSSSDAHVDVIQNVITSEKGKLGISDLAYRPT